MVINLKQAPSIAPNVEALIQLWNAGFAAGRANMTYVVETRMGPRDFLSVARAQVPLINLIQSELYAFSNIGWQALPHYLENGKPLDSRDEERLALFRHDVAAWEGLLPNMVTLGKRNEKRLESWYKGSQDIYRRHLTLTEMVRGICYGFHARASRKRMSLTTKVTNKAHIRSHYFDSAKTAFNNIIQNSIKYGREGGSIHIWDEGLTLFFKDDGHGMDPNFAKQLGLGDQIREKRVEGIPGEGLGWKSIGKTASALDWTWEIHTAVGEGTTVRLDMNDDNFIRPKRSSLNFAALRQLPKRDTVDIFVAGARSFFNALPFEGYLPNGDDMINVANSPIFKAIERARGLIENFR